jgi:hypothetical protein
MVSSGNLYQVNHIVSNVKNDGFIKQIVWQEVRYCCIVLLCYEIEGDSDEEMSVLR